jgi:hypothetical protein
VQILVELEVTDVTPSPVVLTVAVNLPPTVPLAGRLEMVGGERVSATGLLVSLDPTATQSVAEAHETASR